MSLLYNQKLKQDAETYVPAESPAPGKDPWISQADEDFRWAGGVEPPALARAEEANSQLGKITSPKGSDRVDRVRGRQAFPKSARLLKPADFRRVYDQGQRFTSALFAAFCLREPEGGGPRIGFTTPRGLGKAVVRNRVRRRIREALRRQLDQIGFEWWIVINPRRKALDCANAEIEREVARLITRCSTGWLPRPSGSTN